MSKLQMVTDFIEEHCSVIGTPRKKELLNLVTDCFGELVDEKEDLESDMDEKDKEIAELTQNVAFRLEGHHANIRNQMVIDLLNENFENIPIAELEKFIEQYKK